MIGTLSDSFTSIGCRFSCEFLRNYEKKRNVKLQKGSKGAILKLLQFEILVKYGLDTELYIMEFEMHGCEGSRKIGKPHDIYTNETVSKLIKEFARATGGGLDDDDDELEALGNDSDISVQSQPESNAVAAYEHHQRHTSQTTSQEACQTQVPSNQAVLVPRSGAILTPNPRQKSNAKDLLKKLQVSKGSADESPKPDTPGRHQQQALGEEGTQPSETAAPARREGPVQRPSSLTEAGQLPDINARTTVRPSSSNSYDKRLSPSASLLGDREYRERIVSAVPMRAIEGRQEFRSPASPTLRPPQMPAEQSTPSRGPGTPRTRDNAKNGVQLPEDHQGRGYWGDMKRIERRDIYIPKDQQEMIDSPDSWMPPEAGKQMPQAHVPVGILRQWNEHATMRLNARVAIPARQETPVVSADQQTPSSAGTQVTEWSQSPSQRVVLPADSSPPQRPTTRARIGHSNHTPRNFTDEERLDTQLPGDGDEDAGPIMSTNTNGALTLPPINIPAVVGDNSTDSEMETSIPTGFGYYASDIESSNVTSSAPIPEQSHPTQASPAMTVSSGSQGPLPPEKIEVPQSENPRRVQLPQIPSDALVPGTYESRNVASQSLLPSQRSQATRAENLQNPMDLGDDDMVTRQLNSELDSSVFSSHAPGQQDPFRAGLARSQNTDRTTQEELVEVPVSSIETEESYLIASAVASSNKRKRDESVSSRPTKFQKATEQVPNHETTVSSTAGKERKSLDANARVSFFAVEETTPTCQAIYENFKETYPEYAGDIKTFKRACRTLQALANKGEMPRSVLWDDFIVRELVEYPGYIMECFRRQEYPLSYKAYFLNKVTSARLKKRNLSAKKIATVVEDNSISDVDPESQVTNDYIPSLETSQNNGSLTIPGVASESIVEAAVEPAPEETLITEETSVLHKQRSPPSPTCPHKPVKETEGPTNDSIDKDAKYSDDSEWHECDDTHEIASVDLGDESRIISEDNDVEMDDEGSVSSFDEARYAAATAAKDSAVSRSFSFHEVTEIDESDIDDTFRSAELDTSPKLVRTAPSIPRGSPDNREASKLSEKVEGKQKSPGFEEPESVYPPYQPVSPRKEGEEDADVQKEDIKSCHKAKSWWKYTNTPFKQFARRFTAMMNEGEGIQPPEIDGDGVIRPNNRRPGEGPVRGKLGAMGWGV